MSEPQEAYVVREIPLGERLISTAKIAVPVIGIGLWVLIEQVSNNVPIENYWLSLLIIGVGSYFSWKAWSKDISKELTGEWVRPPVSSDIKKRVTIAGVMGAIVVAGLVFQQIQAGEQVLISFLPAIPIIGLVALYIVPQLRPAKVFVPSAVASVEQKRLDEEQAIKAIEAKRKSDEMEDKWWFRYGMAILMVSGAWWIAESRPKATWLAIIIVLAAMVYARELSLFILGAVGVWLLFQGISALPTSVAVVIGACIIAYAVNRPKDKPMPIFGGLIEKWRAKKEAQKAFDGLYNDPLISLAREAVLSKWTNNPDITQGFSAEFIEKHGGTMMTEVLNLMQSDDPVILNRQRLADAVQEFGIWQALIMDPPPVEDPTGIRGSTVTGELKARLWELRLVDDNVQKWFPEAYELIKTPQDLSDMVLGRYRICWVWAELWHTLRFQLEPGNVKDQNDWYRPFIMAMTAYWEHSFRRQLNLPSQLHHDEDLAAIKLLEMGLFRNFVYAGQKDPLDTWNKAVAIIDNLDDIMEKVGQLKAFEGEFPAP